MSGWIKFDKDMVDDPRLVEAAMRIIIDGYVVRHKPGGDGDALSLVELRLLACYAVTGALVTLWRYADEHIADDDTLPLSLYAVDALVGLGEGFCEALPDDWIVELDDGRVKLPGYCEKNQLITKRKRAQQAKARMANMRGRRRSVTQSVTPSVTHGVTPPVTSDVTPVTQSVTQVLRAVDGDIRKNSKKGEGDRGRGKGNGSPDPPVVGLDLEAWDRWEKYRKAIKKPIRPVSVAAAQRKLAGYGPDQSAVVEQSIAEGYQGLFALKGGPAGTTKGKGDPYAGAI